MSKAFSSKSKMRTHLLSLRKEIISEDPRKQRLINAASND